MKNNCRILNFALALILHTSCAAAAFSDPGTIDWMQTLGTQAGEIYGGAALDHLGHVYVAGTTDGSLAGPPNLYGSNFLAQYSTTGNLNWLRQFGVSANVAHGVAADGQGNAYIVGETSSRVG